MGLSMPFGCDAIYAFWKFDFIKRSSEIQIAEKKCYFYRVCLHTLKSQHDNMPFNSIQKQRSFCTFWFEYKWTWHLILINRSNHIKFDWSILNMRFHYSPTHSGYPTNKQTIQFDIAVNVVVFRFCKHIYFLLFQI